MEGWHVEYIYIGDSDVRKGVVVIMMEIFKAQNNVVCKYVCGLLKIKVVL
jgi:hypothetical protein